jgi:hypothetical protein
VLVNCPDSASACAPHTTPACGNAVAAAWTSGTFAGIVGVYQRHDFADEKRDALERGARHVMSLTAPIDAILPSKAVA